MGLGFPAFYASVMIVNISSGRDNRHTFTMNLFSLLSRLQILLNDNIRNYCHELKDFTDRKQQKAFQNTSVGARQNNIRVPLRQLVNFSQFFWPQEC